MVGVCVRVLFWWVFGRKEAGSIFHNLLTVNACKSRVDDILYTEHYKENETNRKTEINTQICVHKKHGLGQGKARSWEGGGTEH